MSPLLTVVMLERGVSCYANRLPGAAAIPGGLGASWCPAQLDGHKAKAGLKGEHYAVNLMLALKLTSLTERVTTKE